MSSMRNAVARRNHKERAQPEARAKWGLLEKHKDYSLRAKDYNVKKQKLNVLSQKTREKNPDEFAFGMLSADKGAQGKHGRGDQDKNRLSHDAVKLLKTQDSGYLRTAAARGRKEIDRLSQQVSMDGVMKRGTLMKGKKISFGDDGQPPVKRRRLSEGSTEDVDMDVGIVVDEFEANGVGQANGHLEDSDIENAVAKPKSKKQLEKERDLSTRLKAERRRRKLLRERRTVKLLELKKRQKEVLAAADQLELQRAKMAKAIGGTNKNGIKFKIRERKR